MDDRFGPKREDHFSSGCGRWDGRAGTRSATPPGRRSTLSSLPGWPSSVRGG